jgi:hypothetical protein
VSQKSSPWPRPARTSPSIPLRSSQVTEDGWERVESRRSHRRCLAPPPAERFLWTYKDTTSIVLPPHTSLPPNALLPLSRARAPLFQVPATARNVEDAWVCYGEHDGLAPGIRGGHSCQCWVRGEHLDVR